MHPKTGVGLIVHGFGGGEDATVGALVQRYGWPVIGLDSTTAGRVPITIPHVIWGPCESFRGSHKASWLPALLRRPLERPFDGGVRCLLHLPQRQDGGSPLTRQITTRTAARRTDQAKKAAIR